MDFTKEIQDLKDQIESRPGPDNKLTMIVFSGELDKHLAALIIATGAAAMGMKVVLFYTFWATAALRAPKKKPKGKNLIEKMFGVMLPKGNRKLILSNMHMLGAGTAMMKGLMKKKNIASLDEMYEMAGALGVTIYVCEMSMDLMGMKLEEMIDYPGIKSVGVASMLAEAKESSVQFFI